jgi:energy-coupling factor transporter ATP-binding protein EcfA2
MAIPKPTLKKKSPPPIPQEQKKFTVESWNTHEGERIIVYGDTGIGKTTLTSTAGKTVFIPLDEGGGKITHPITGESLKRIPNIKSFSDVREALQSYPLFDDYDTIVIDNVTLLQDLAEQHVVATIPTDSNIKVNNILGYGYNKGYKHLYNTMKLILTDCDELVRRGKNVILIAQSAIHNVPNPQGEDFIRAGLRLHVDKVWNIESLYCEWADHILRVDYHNAFIKRKKVTGSTERAVFVQPELYFRAKSRTVKEPVVSFETEADTSIWQFIFGDKNGTTSKK